MSWLEKAPKDQQDFFKKSFVRSKTSFSTESRIEVRCDKDDGISFVKSIPEWSDSTIVGGKKPRPRITNFLGALKKTPGPGAYDDRDELRSKLESAPAYSLSSRHYPEKIGNWSDPGPGSYDIPNVLDKYAVVKGKREKNVNTPPKLSTPGPQNYDQPLKFKYPQSPQPKLKPRKSPEPRKMVDSHTLEITERYQQKFTVGPLMYDTEVDPRQISKSMSIGEKRERISGIPVCQPNMPPGPGSYDPDGCLEFGMEEVQSKPLSKDLHKGGNIKAIILQRNGRTAAEHRIKLQIQKNYHSPYSFPKKPPVSRFNHGR